MKVVLPDSTELELPDGATGLDAARAIGPKLAEQAVLVRSNGAVQDLRLPLRDGQPVQFLTTRDKDDPDALSVLRHSTAHLLAEAVRRLYPGVKVAIGPPIENGFYYDFEFPEPIREEDLERIEAEILRELKEGRSWEREEISAAEAKQRFLEENEPYKVELVDTAEGEISLYTQGGFTDLCRGPHLQDSKPIKAVKLTGLAGAYWRGDEKNAQLTRIYGTAFYSEDDLKAHLERIEQAKARDHRKLGRELDLFHFEDVAPASALWHPKGMVLWNALEDLRRKQNAKRGYLEVKTPLMWDIELWKRSGHWDKYRENIFLIPYGDSTYGLKPMNCPGHMLLFAADLRSYRELPLRYAEAARAAPRRAGRRAPRPRPCPNVQPGRCARLLHRGAGAGGDRRDVRLRRLPLRRCSECGRSPTRSWRRVRDEQARHGRAMGPHGRRAAAGSRAARDPVHALARARAPSTGRRSTSS